MRPPSSRQEARPARQLRAVLHGAEPADFAGGHVDHDADGGDMLAAKISLRQRAQHFS